MDGYLQILPHFYSNAVFYNSLQHVFVSSTYYSAACGSQVTVHEV